MSALKKLPSYNNTPLVHRPETVLRNMNHDSAIEELQSQLLELETERRRIDNGAAFLSFVFFFARGI
jgi:hypothetical protein